MKKFSVRTVCQMALLIALEVVLTRLCGISTLLTKIGLGFIPMAVCGMLFGPWMTALAYALADIIGALLFPAGAYSPLFTLTAALMGVCYGMLLHREKISFFPHIVLAAVIYAVVLSLGLNTAWITLLYGSTYFARIATRLPQCLILLAAQLLLLPLCGTLCKRLKKAGIVL